MLNAELRGSRGRQLIDAGGAVNIIKKVLYCTYLLFFLFVFLIPRFLILRLVSTAM